MITKEDLLKMNNRQLFEVMKNGHAIDSNAVAGKMYLGIDLSLPPIMHKILWKTFRKIFYNDPQTGRIRGWNVRLKQTGLNPPTTALIDKKGNQISFGHYELLDAKGKKFPRGWEGDQYLDYTVIGNKWHDLGKLGYCPLVAVNNSSIDLLLGWEVFKIGPVFFPLNDFWLLQLEGELDKVVEIPN